MAFTGVLGTSDSYLGNVVLGTTGGGGGGSVANESLTIAGTADFASSVFGINNLSVTVNGSSAVSVAGGFDLAKTLSIDGTSSCVGLDGFRYQQTLTVAGTSALVNDEGFGLSNSVTVAASASVAVAYLHFNFQSVTISGTSACSATFVYFVNTVLTVAASAAISSPGGLVYNIQRSIEGTSSLATLPGFLYEETFQIDGSSDIAVVFVYIQNELLTISATADFAMSSLYTANAPLTIAGTSGLAIVSIADFVQTITLSATSTLYVENFYEILFVSAAICSFTIAVDHRQNSTENPGAVGSCSVAAQCVFARSVTQTLSLDQSVTVKKPTQISSQSLTFAQSVAVVKVHIESLTDTLTMTQDAFAVRAISQSLTLTDIASCVKVLSRSVSQTFAISNTLTRTATISRGLSNTLVFNTPNLQRLPIIGSQSQTQNRQFEYYIPTVNVVLVPRKCLIILGCPSQTVVLPCPLWGDSQALQSSIDLKRSMTGITYTYVKKSRTQKLKYSFEIWTYKYLELRDFFINHSEEVMTLQNHNAETWLVNITNNPMEFTAAERWQPKGEKYTVTLEFEGVKIGG
jgi:hypothetical protein